MCRDALIEFLNENPTPTDAQFHAFAMSINVDKETLEAEAFSMLSAFLRKFDAAHAAPDDMFDEDELRVGTQVETEHTDDEFIASIIAKDHLLEKDTYYTDLLTCMGEHEELLDELEDDGQEADMDPNGAPGSVHRIDSGDLTRLNRLDSKLPRLVENSSAKPLRQIKVRASGADSQDLDSTQVYDIYSEIASQVYIDRTARLLAIDGFRADAQHLSQAYAEFRSAVVNNAQRCMADPLAYRAKKAIEMANLRQNGEMIRIAYARFATSALRTLTAKFGDGAGGQFYMSASQGR